MHQSTLFHQEVYIYASIKQISDGPYNPNKYNPMLTPKDYPTNKEIE